MIYVDVGSGYHPYKKFKTCDLQYSCTYYDIKEIENKSVNLFRCRNVIHHVNDLNEFLGTLATKLVAKGTLIIIDCLHKDFSANVFLDILWYRGIKQNHDIFIAKEYRTIPLTAFTMIYQSIRGGKLWIKLQKK